MHTQSLTDQWQFRESKTDEWLPAQVPGSVQTDLLALDRIPDPFVADAPPRVPSDAAIDDLPTILASDNPARCFTWDKSNLPGDTEYVEAVNDWGTFRPAPKFTS